ncbi:MAG: hypothetical protein ACRBBK_14700 [Paracoccaceae bacterium]
MKQALSLLILVIALFQLGARIWDAATMLQIGYGAISIMAMLISITFLWLWQVRATPLALGMSFSWAGSGLVMGYWWMMQMAGLPQWGREAELLLVFLAFLIAGAVLHFAVIQASFGYHGLRFLAPVALAIALASAALVLH